ncbi:MAG: TonB-dependent receptor plug domain-containing protein [Gemmatimonadales bacterium]
MRTLALGLVLAAALPAAFSRVEAQALASLSGTVVDDLNGVPLVNAIVSVPQLGLRAATDPRGQFLLEGVPPGPHEVKFEALGYVGVTERLVVADADFLQIRLDPMAAVLDEIMVMAGRAPAAGVPVRATRAPDPERPWLSALDLLDGQVPGVVVRRGGGLANGAAILIRGVNSFRNDGAPVIIVDGVRLESAQTGDNSFHTLDLIPADVVSRIRVIKGAADASAYSNAANGVILIETIRGDERD